MGEKLIWSSRVSGITAGISYLHIMHIAHCPHSRTSLPSHLTSPRPHHRQHHHQVDAHSSAHAWHPRTHRLQTSDSPPSNASSCWRGRPHAFGESFRPRYRSSRGPHAVICRADESKLVRRIKVFILAAQQDSWLERRRCKVDGRQRKKKGTRKKRFLEGLLRSLWCHRASFYPGCTLYGSSEKHNSINPLSSLTPLRTKDSID